MAFGNDAQYLASIGARSPLLTAALWQTLR